uniref:Uncharacterized protein n=1 Tax=Anopheles coluzzii TaxID=1518534 RepID=A0A6E8W833_ANOCL
MSGKRLTSFVLVLLLFISLSMGDEAPSAKTNDITAEPTQIDTSTFQKCCPRVMKPIVLTAKPKIKYIVVPPESIT